MLQWAELLLQNSCPAEARRSDHSYLFSCEFLRVCLRMESGGLIQAKAIDTSLLAIKTVTSANSKNRELVSGHL